MGVGVSDDHGTIQHSIAQRLGESSSRTNSATTRGAVLRSDGGNAVQRAGAAGIGSTIRRLGLRERCGSVGDVMRFVRLSDRPEAFRCVLGDLPSRGRDVLAGCAMADAISRSWGGNRSRRRAAYSDDRDCADSVPNTIDVGSNWAGI